MRAQHRIMSETRVPPDLSPPLSWVEICERYPDEWVVLVEIDWVNDTDFDFRSARVAGHGKSRKDPLIQARPLHSLYPSMGHFFTGTPRAPLSPLFLM
jgi:hypothetical protein